jgi:predicted ester cyclase
MTPKTIFIPAENTRHSENPGQNSEIKCMPMHLNGEDVQFTDFMRQNAENGKINSLKSYFEKTNFWVPYPMC